jgi:hypothetical protein
LKLVTFAGFAMLAALACTDEFPLGSWDAVPAPVAGSAGTEPGAAGNEASGGSGAGGSDAMAGMDGSGATSGTGVGGAGGSGTSGASSILPECLTPGVPAAPNQPGTMPGTTDTITEFPWPAPMDSLEWDVLVEKPLERDGYYWMNQFSFVGTNVGFFGIQERGGYYTVPNPSPSQVEFTKMVVFWISLPPSIVADIENHAELGDIEGPDARALADPSGTFITIHAKFEWETCKVYRLRVGLESMEPNGDRWIGAWILDVEAERETFFGRILLPAEAGQFATFTRFRTTPIERVSPMSCAEAEPSSALFGMPTGNLGTMFPIMYSNKFSNQLRCGTSRFTVFPTAIRHELGIER